MTEHTPTTSRRRLLNAAPVAAALAGAGISIAAAHAAQPAAALIALCIEYVRANREFCAVGAHTWEMLCDDPEWVRCYEAGCAMVPALHAMEAQITDMPARTLPGIRAKAEAARHQMSADADRDAGPLDPQNEMAWSLIGKIADLAGGAAA